MARVLLIEDDLALSVAMRGQVRALGHEVRSCPSAELGLEEARSFKPQAVLLDIHLPGRSGLSLLPELLALPEPPAVAIITSAPTAENAIDALARGAQAHLSKPLDPERLEVVLAGLLAARGAEPSAEASPGQRYQLVGRSPAMLDLGRRIGALARSEVTVLITGESGTGKELAARAIHRSSPRSAAPFVALNCAALPDALFEAELFGHARGAFTGAERERQGRVELAEGGVLFLDEVAELSPAAQAKLLRFLEERSFERVGDARARQASVRVVAATNATLEDAVSEGLFREDLYYRLDVARLALPPLRTRREDIPLLATHLLAGLGRPGLRLDPAAEAALIERRWTGNVRELRNALEVALVQAGQSQVLRVEHLPPPKGGSGAGPQGLEAIDALLEGLVQEAPEEGDLHARLKERLEATLIRAALRRTEGNQVAATRLLGMNRATFRRKM